MFLDEYSILAQAGHGGPGAVHFARRKYQPFGGPDGGDGGDGGDVVLVGRRELDSLDHLRTLKTRAAAGTPGGANQLIGARGVDCALDVPLGTLAFNVETGDELGAVLQSGQRLMLTRGGKGGQGNPHYATGRRRAPKLAGPGKAGAALDVLLRFRLYCDTALIEPALPDERCLLPRLLAREPQLVDFELYRRKPRWVRHEADYRRYDFAYLPLDISADGRLAGHMLQHLYWARSVVLNLTPLAEQAEGVLADVVQALDALPLRRLEQGCVCSAADSGRARLTSQNGIVALDACRFRGPDDTLACLETQLLGGCID